jgi:hypothetical protein
MEEENVVGQVVSIIIDDKNDFERWVNRAKESIPATLGSVEGVGVESFCMLRNNNF